MLKHVLTTFIRSASAAKFQFATIVFGLGVGIAVGLLIYVYVREEKIFDTHHEASGIYRVNTVLEMEGKV
ncbi:MAG TPA: hypothetical protein VM260_22205, partial [Pirellula sp.]|nr:hypothetical protein [Pirellula sp.]